MSAWLTPSGRIPRGAQKTIGDELHAFQKKSNKAIETAKHDVTSIKKRYAEAKERAKHEEK
jgi:hypothetical protein